MKNLIFLSTLLGVLFTTSCGEQPTSEESKNQDTLQKTQTSTPGIYELTLSVTGNSMSDMAYEPSSFSVKSGDKVTLTLKNTNSMEGMLHNVVIVNLGTGQEVATEAITAGASKNFIPDNKNVLASSQLAKPLETIVFEFVAPAPGVYNYICTYPGHFPQMIGKLYVD